ncbi:helix-turn-helix domain-containing protein [Streptomyces sp. NPDC002018]|uniref:helix-turn-helix domain-containing protein n=1 Tax=Streptomyces sp. NPDC002018 TaxID=3364629 RepID=UPI00368813AB
MIFGEELRRLRIDAGMSLAELAAVVHYSKGHLSKIETGSKTATPDLARRCDTVLGAKGALAALAVGRSSSEARNEEQFEHEGEVWSMVLLPDGTSSFQPMARRDVMIGGAASLMGLGIRPRSASAAARLESTLPAYRALFDQTRRMGQSLSPSMVLPTVVTQTHSLYGLARQASEPVRGEVLKLTARYAEYAGWMAQESGNDKAALWWTGKAVEFAAAGGDRHLSAYALVRQALVALYREDAAQTIDLARQAQASSLTPPRIRGLAAQREAQGHALAGDYDSCRRALDRAAALLADPDSAPAPVSASGTDKEPVLGTATVSDPVAVVTGWCLHELGSADEAIEILDREVARIPADAVRSRTRFGTRRALAYAAAGHVDEACRLTGQLLDDADAIDSATVATDLRRIARTLSRWRNDPQVQRLYPKLTASLQTPAL